MSRSTILFCFVMMLHNVKRIQSFFTRSSNHFRFPVNLFMSTDGHDTSILPKMTADEESVIKSLKEYDSKVPR